MHGFLHLPGSEAAVRMTGQIKGRTGKAVKLPACYPQVFHIIITHSLCFKCISEQTVFQCNNDRLIIGFAYLCQPFRSVQRFTDRKK